MIHFDFMFDSLNLNATMLFDFKLYANSIKTMAINYFSIHVYLAFPTIAARKLQNCL